MLLQLSRPAVFVKCWIVSILVVITACRWSVGQDQPVQVQPAIESTSQQASPTTAEPSTQTPLPSTDATAPSTASAASGASAINGLADTTSRSSGSSPEAWVSFSKDIAPILREHCLSCHRGEQPKGGFDITDRSALLGYITPGSVQESTLWTDYLTAKPISEDPQSLVMPPDGPLSKSELALLKYWIEEGASWPESESLDERGESKSPAVSGANASMLRRIYLAIGYFHPAVVHFPIALLSIAGIAIVLSWLFGQGCVRFAYVCLLLGAIGSLAAAVMGWSFAELRGLSDWNQMITSAASERESNEFFHRWLGTITAILSLVVAWFAYRAGRSDGTRPGWGWKSATLALAVLVGLVGHQGGEMVYGDIFTQAIEQFNPR